ncbi:MAG: FtsX-like permease family protein [Actinobacteria bacterium]|nr:FtsX-like permease family protein [Actinomycetota bacterium]
MLKMSWKGVLAHKVRLGLTGLAIVLGVAFISGSFVFTDRMSSAFDDLFAGSTDGIDLVIQEGGSLGFTAGKVPEEILDQVLAVEGVSQAIPTVQGFAQMIDKDGEPIGGSGPPTFGFSIDAADFETTMTSFVEGRLPESGEAMIDVFTARANGFEVGDSVDVIFTTGVETLEIVGTIGFGDADNMLGATVVALDLSDAQRLMGYQGAYASISVVADPGADLDQLRSALQQAVADPDVEVVLAADELAEQLEQVDTVLGFFNTFLVAIGAIALFVAAFLISNTFRIIVSQRTRELALLRAVGATGRQVTVIVVLEAFIVGVIASAIGIGVGVLLAVGIQGGLEAFGISFPSGGLVVKFRTVAFGMGFGVFFTMISAIIPAVRASRVPPVAALRETAVGFSKPLRKRVIAGVAITSVGLVMLFAGLFGSFSKALLVMGIGAGLTFIGVAVIAPFFSRGFGRIFGAPLPRMFGVTGRLAQENAVRKPRRMAATASALMIGVALVSILAVLAASAKTTIKGAVEDEVIAEYQIEARGFADPTSTGVSPALKASLATVPGVEFVSSYRVGPYLEEGGSTTLYLAAVDDVLDKVIRWDVLSGSYADLAPGKVMVDADWAADKGIGVGDTVTIEPREGHPVDFAVAATFSSDLFQGVPIVMSLADFEQYYSLGLEAMVMLKLADGVDAEAIRPALETLVDEYPNVELSNAAEYVAKTAGQVDTFLNILTALLGLAIFIALMGIMNTLALSIFERKREIGLLRAVGMTRRQVRRMIRWEAILIAVFGAVIGLVVGSLLGIAIVYGIGSGLVLTMPLGTLAGYAVFAAIGGFLASLWPSYSGARTDLLEAISFE